jgi:hypothetical protein
MLGVATCVVAFAVCLAIFAALDISATHLVAPAIAVGAGAFATYMNALGDRSRPREDDTDAPPRHARRPL